MELAQIYKRVAEQFAIRIREMFSMETALQTAFRFQLRVPFSRTDYWHMILQRELTEIWYEYGLPVKAPLTEADIRSILQLLCSELDFNLFSQVLLNLQPARLIRYRCQDAKAKEEEMRVKWADHTPSVFDTKPKMFKMASTAEEEDYNKDLSALRALRIISLQTFNRSFRVTPIGHTPAFADSENLSMLGFGADEFLDVPEGFQAYYFTWDAAPDLLEQHGGHYHYPGLDYPFESHSPEILNEVLYARRLTQFLFLTCGPDAAFLPRMKSVLLVSATPPPETLTAELRELGSIEGGFLFEGKRIDKALLWAFAEPALLRA